VSGNGDADADALLTRALNPVNAAAADAQLLRRALDPACLDVLATGRWAGYEFAQKREWRQPLAPVAGGVTPSRSMTKISVAFLGIVGGSPPAP
jgi:hypothetical protein